MKKFSLRAYYLKYFIFLVVSFVMHIFFSFGIIGGFRSGGWTIILSILAVLLHPLGFWNLFFYFFALPLDQAFRPNVWLVSILSPSLVLIAFLILLQGALPYNFLSFLAFWAILILSNALFYFLGYLGARNVQVPESEEDLNKKKD